jgi:hypothetical protein
VVTGPQGTPWYEDDQYLRDLDDELQRMERDHPDVADAARRYDEMVDRILARVHRPKPAP